MLGGGTEYCIAIFFVFMWGCRVKYYYYLAIFCLDKVIIGYFKLAYAAPRPYMIEGSIHPVQCSEAFGMPSGHCSAAMISTITIFLDVFHGTPVYQNSQPTFYNNW